MFSLFYLFCTRLNQALNLRQICFSVRYSAELLKFIYCLKNNKLIYGYSVIGERNNNNHRQILIVVYLVYILNTPLISRLFIYTGKKHFFFFSYATLIKFQNTSKSYLNPVFFLQTDSGFFTNYELMQKSLKKGGKIVAYLI